MNGCLFVSMRTKTVHPNTIKLGWCARAHKGLKKLYSRRFKKHQKPPSPTRDFRILWFISFPLERLRAWRFDPRSRSKRVFFWKSGGIPVVKQLSPSKGIWRLETLEILHIEPISENLIPDCVVEITSNYCASFILNYGNQVVFRPFYQGVTFIVKAFA